MEQNMQRCSTGALTIIRELGLAWGQGKEIETIRRRQILL
jgi:hypothetical protein